MKPQLFISSLALITLTQSSLRLGAVTTIDATNRFAYGANIGWTDWRGDETNGVVIGEYVCSGYLYAANVGWINCGNGVPANGIHYQNVSSNDFGVNHDGLGNLNGYAYSANCGWISLRNAFAKVQTTSIQAGTDSDGDGIADAWERQKFGNLFTADASSDTDHDGFTDRKEYLADTDPNDPQNFLHITDFNPGFNGAQSKLTWTSVPTRHYLIEESFNLTQPLWADSGLGSIPADGNITTRDFFDTPTPSRFYRVEAIRPLSQ